jgi:hypothetical protein
MVPFEAVFGATETRIGSVLDWNMLLAIVVCAVIGWGVTSLIRNAGYASAAMIEEVEQVDRTGRP